MSKIYCEKCKKCIKVLHNGELYCAGRRPIKKVTVKLGEDTPKWCPKNKQQHIRMVSELLMPFFFCIDGGLEKAQRG